MALNLQRPPKVPRKRFVSTLQFRFPSIETKFSPTIRSTVKEEADQDRKSVENVARPKDGAKNKVLARQESIQKKIIDEARVNASIIKNIVKDKKKEHLMHWRNLDLLK